MLNFQTDNVGNYSSTLLLAKSSATTEQDQQSHWCTNSYRGAHRGCDRALGVVSGAVSGQNARFTPFPSRVGLKWRLPSSSMPKSQWSLDQRETGWIFRFVAVPLAQRRYTPVQTGQSYSDMSQPFATRYSHPFTFDELRELEVPILAGGECYPCALSDLQY